MENQKKKYKKLREILLVLSAYFAITIPLSVSREDNYIDHTSNVCNITRFLNKHFDSDNELSLGDKHQIKEMQQAYKKQGKNVTVERDMNHLTMTKKEKYIKPEAYKLSDGTIVYVIPKEYENNEDLIPVQEVIEDAYVSTFEDGTQKTLIRP